MAHRRIGQEVFRFSAGAERQNSLDELAVLIDWSNPDRVLAPLYPAAKGEKAWPPLAMFKALLLAVWYDLSDVILAEALSDRASFRRFCGFSRDEATPERTAFVRFRGALVEQGLDDSRRAPPIFMGSFQRGTLQGISRLIDIEVEIFGSNLGECAIRHASVQGFLEHGLERLVFHPDADADTVAEIGRIVRHVRGKDAASCFLAPFHVIGESVLVADDRVKLAFGEIENGFLERRVGTDFRLFVNILDVGLMGSARLDANGLANEARRTRIQRGVLLQGHESGRHADIGLGEGDFLAGFVGDFHRRHDRIVMMREKTRD